MEGSGLGEVWSPRNAKKYCPAMQSLILKTSCTPPRGASWYLHNTGRKRETGAIISRPSPLRCLGARFSLLSRRQENSETDRQHPSARTRPQRMKLHDQILSWQKLCGGWSREPCWSVVLGRAWRTSGAGGGRIYGGESPAFVVRMPEWRGALSG